MTTTAARVKALREALRLSQEEIGRRAGFSEDDGKARVYVSKIETGKNQLSTAKAREQTARGFGITVAQLNAYLAGGLELEALVAQRSAPPTQAAQPERVVVYDERSPLEIEDDDSPLDRALLEAIDKTKHTLGDAASVRRVTRSTLQNQHLDGDLVAAARAWLDAAAHLRRAGIRVTAEAMLPLLTVGIKATAQQHERAREADDALTAENRAAAAERGFVERPELVAKARAAFARRARRAGEDE
jgi:transcriptional regulator with XRE-family HTH domain